MAALVFSIFLTLAALVGFALAVAWVRRSPLVGVSLVCLMILPLWERPPLLRSAIVTLAGASVYIPDVITLLLFSAGVLQVRQLRANLRGWFIPWILFGVLIAVALLRTVVTDGPASGFNGMRWLSHFFWAMTWALGVRPDRFRLHTVSLVLGWALVLIAFYHAVRYGFGGAVSSVSLSDNFVQTGRVLTATQSMALSLCAASVFMGTRGSAESRQKFYAASSLVFAGVVVIAQHRSVWAASALGLVAVLVWSARRKARKQVFVQLVLGAGAVLFAWYSGALSGSEISQSAASTSTYEWRAAGWHILISQAIARGPVSVFLGEPSANIFLRELNPGQWTSVSAHNWYVDIFLYLGVLGLLLIVTMLVSALVKSREMPAIWTFALAAVAVYGWAYSVEWHLAPWLGAAMTMSLGARRNSEDTVPKSDLVPGPDLARVTAG